MTQHVRAVQGLGAAIVALALFCGPLARSQQPPPAAPVAQSQPGTHRSPAVPPPPGGFDYSRIVRIWNVPPPSTTTETTSSGPTVGSRIVLSSNVPAAEDLALLASAGFTLLQTDSDHLSTEEVRPNGFDFGPQDAARLASLRAGFDWCYFPHFAFPPPWYSQKIQYPRIRCLEHDQTVEAFSPWDPNFGYFVSRGYQVLARHFGQTVGAGSGPGSAAVSSSPMSMPAFYVGIHGDYGECGVFIGARTSVPGQKEDWERRFGNLHNHVGWWCGDALARASFRTTMLGRYGGLAALNAAWRTNFKDADSITYPANVNAGSRRYWLDFVNWYRQSISNMTDVVSRIARRTFPSALLMLPCGFGDEDPRTGADNSMLARIAARHRMDLRSTHGGYQPFAENQATMLGRLASACRFYGVPFWSEPPSTISPDGQVQRIFEAITLGARGHFDWSSNVKTGREAYYRYGKYMRVSRRVVDVAMFYPTTSHLLRPDEGYPPLLRQGCTTIRDILDYDIVDERMVLDGALDRYRVLVLWEGAIVEAPVLERIRAWVEQGGVLVAYDFGKIETVEGSLDWFRDVLGYAGRLTPAAGSLRFTPAPGARQQTAYRITVGATEAVTYLEGDWYPSEETGGVLRRWAGADAHVLLPVKGGTDMVLTVRASFPPEAAGLRREVLVNGTQVGILDLAGEHTYRFGVPSNLTVGRNVSRVTFRCETFAPSERIAGSSDGRSLGVWVSYVQLSQDTAESALTDPGMPQGTLEVSVDYQRLRSEWARRLGRGWTIYFPAKKDQLRAYCEVVRYATYHLSDLDTSKKDAIAIDDAWDGVYATLCTDKAVYYNPTQRRVFRTIVLSPSALAANREVVRLSRFTHELTLEPRSISVIPFTPAPAELLLQCEKFTILGSIKPQPGPQFSPGVGDTHVLVPEGGSISTRFECPVSGRFRVFYRTWRRNALCPANITVNGKPCAPVTGIVQRGGTETLCAGEVSLERGVHTLTIRPRPGQDLRADYVILSSDPDIAGYGFAVK